MIRLQHLIIGTRTIVYEQFCQTFITSQIESHDFGPLLTPAPLTEYSNIIIISFTRKIREIPDRQVCLPAVPVMSKLT